MLPTCPWDLAPWDGPPSMHVRTPLLLAAPHSLASHAVLQLCQHGKVAPDSAQAGQDLWERKAAAEGKQRRRTLGAGLEPDSSAGSWGATPESPVAGSLERQSSAWNSRHNLPHKDGRSSSPIRGECGVHGQSSQAGSAPGLGGGWRWRGEGMSQRPF